MSRETRSWLAELQRRKVYRSAAVYAGIAWAVLQIADLVFPRLGLPDWTVTLALAIAGIGFPLTILFAWHFDVTPEGIRRTPGREAAAGTRRSPFRVFEFLLILGLVFAVGYLYFDRIWPDQADLQASPSVFAEGPRSIAVLPFVNMSQDADNEYFSDGVAEQILDSLARIEKLRVAARTSSFSFKGRNDDIREIGAKLGVATILEGSVRKSGDRLRITAQLVNTANGYHLWSDTYDRELTDIFAVQDEIARSIAAALKVPLGLPPDTRIIQPGTADTVAYNDYLRGLYFFKMIGPETFQRTIEFMQRAIARDPEVERMIAEMEELMRKHGFELPASGLRGMPKGSSSSSSHSRRVVVENGKTVVDEEFVDGKPVIPGSKRPDAVPPKPRKAGASGSEKRSPRGKLRPRTR